MTDADLFGAMIDLHKINRSLCWLRAWAKKKKTTETEFLECKEDEEFHDCPHYDMVMYAILALNPKIARRTSKGYVAICPARLAKLKL